MAIDESVTRYTQLPVLLDIEWIEVCMTSQTFVVRQFKQGWTLHIEHTVPPQNARYTDYVRMETIWTMESNRNHPSWSCHHWFDRNNTLLLGHWMSHTHPRSSSLQGSTLIVSLFNCFDELEIRVVSRMHRWNAEHNAIRSKYLVTHRTQVVTLWIVDSCLQYTWFEFEDLSDV